MILLLRIIIAVVIIVAPVAAIMVKVIPIKRTRIAMIAAVTEALG